MKESEQNSLRKEEGSLRLLVRAIGSREQVRDKIYRIGRTLRLYFDSEEIHRRLQSLEDHRYFERRPHRSQLFFGSLDMLRFVINPAARDYYRQQGISYGFHQVLRVLDDPVSMIDPTGLLSERDTIIGHVMQVVHLNPIYDLQLMHMFPDDEGIEEFERQVVAMVDGSHPRYSTISAIVEESDYHPRLLAYVREFRVSGGKAQPPRRDQSIRDDPHFAAAERTFATLPGFIQYCHHLPTSFWSSLLRLARLRRFPLDLASDTFREGSSS